MSTPQRSPAWSTAPRATRLSASGGSGLAAADTDRQIGHRNVKKGLLPCRSTGERA